MPKQKPERQKQTYGYVRISTTEQHEDRQLIALLPFAIPPANLYIDKQREIDDAHAAALCGISVRTLYNITVERRKREKRV